MVSISLLLPLLLLLHNTLVGFGTLHTQGSAVIREPPRSVTRGSSLTSEEDAGRAMKRGFGEVSAPVVAADVTVEDDDHGSAGEADEAFESSGKSGANVRSR